MATRALVDTTILYAAANQRERHHRAGLAIVQAADHGRIPQLVVPDVVLLETMNGVHRDLGPGKAHDLLARLEEGAAFQLTREPDIVWRTGLEIFRNHPPLSLGDAVQVAAARHHEIPYVYSFDAGFDLVEALTRLATPTDPYAP